MKVFADELRRLNTLSLPELRAEYERTHGEPARSNNRIFLLKRIAWRMQAAAEGGLSERARARAAELAALAKPRQRPTAAAHAEADAVLGGKDGGGEALPPEGACLRRMYKGREIVVTIHRKGVEYDGRMYRSLTAVAKAVTGSSWNGRLFFGMRQRRRSQ